MAGFVSTETIKQQLAECPICNEYFDDRIRIPRRLPCCTQSICEPCLGICSRGSQTFLCPMCRQPQNLPYGINSLPKETLILRFLDHLKLAGNSAVQLCTFCPQRSPAMATCSTCCVLLCHECLRLHGTKKDTKGHITSTLEQASTSGPEADNGSSSEREEKEQDEIELLAKEIHVDEMIEKFTKLKENHKKVKKTVEDQISAEYDQLTKYLKKRRDELLSELEKKTKEDGKKIDKMLNSCTQTRKKLKKARESSSGHRALHAPSDDFISREFVFVSEKNQVLSGIKDWGFLLPVVTSHGNTAGDGVTRDSRASQNM